MSSLSTTISEVSALIDEINAGFDVESLKKDLTDYISALKQDREMVKQLTQQIEIERQSMTTSTRKQEELSELNDQANNALMSSKAVMDKYKATLTFLKKAFSE